MALALAGVASPVAATPLWRAVVTIDNPAGPALVDHEVAMTLDTGALIAAGRLRPDGADLRFTDAAGSLLCHSVESGLGGPTTLVWVKVPAVPAHAATTITVAFGDPTAVSTDDPSCTFSFFEGFAAAGARLAPLCGSVTAVGGDGTLALAWSGSGLVASDVSLPPGQVYVAEARVLGASGAWPGLYWMKAGAETSYGLVADTAEGVVRLGRTAPAADGPCFGHDWITDPLPHQGHAGLWQLVWPETGTLLGSFPGVGVLAASDATWTRDESLRLVLGGVAAGSGAMLVDWVRARKYAAVPPVAFMGVARHLCADQPGACDDADACTDDACDPLAGCTHTAVACDDGDACSDDACDPAAGCTHTAVACDDGDVCTDDACDPAAGCVTAPVACDDGDTCTDDACDPRTGCEHAPVRGATFLGVGCGLNALRSAVERARSGAPPKVVSRLLDKATRLVERAGDLAERGRAPKAGRRLRAAGRTLSRLARKLRKLVTRGAVDTIEAKGWAAEADALAAAVGALRDGL